MKTGFSLKFNQTSPLRTVLLFILVLVLIASAVLSMRLSTWSESRGNRISLSSGGTNSTLRVYNASQGTRPLSGRASDENYNIHDDKVVWQTETHVDIFSESYLGSGKYNKHETVESVDGDKVVAPGTEGTYRFTIENTSLMPMYYELTFDSWNKGFKYQIPLEARVSNEKGEYLFGSATEWADFNDLPQCKDSKTLDVGKSMTYTLDWRWTFHRDWEDWSDTALGNQSSYNEFHNYDWIECGVKIMTYAEIDEPVPETPKPTQQIITPPTPAATGGKAWALVNLISTILATGIGIWQTVVFAKKHEDDVKLSAEENEKLRKRRKLKIWDLVPAVASIVAFILTEDMRQPMTWVDKWTPMMLAFLAVSGLYVYLTRLKAKAEETETVGSV